MLNRDMVRNIIDACILRADGAYMEYTDNGEEIKFNALWDYKVIKDEDGNNVLNEQGYPTYQKFMRKGVTEDDINLVSGIIRKHFTNMLPGLVHELYEIKTVEGGNEQ